MSHLDTLLRVDTSGGDCVLTLPPVSESAGLMFTIKFVANPVEPDLPLNTLVVTDNKDSEEWEDFVLTDLGDVVVLFSDSQQWHRVALERISAPVGPPVEEEKEGEEL